MGGGASVDVAGILKAQTEYELQEQMSQLDDACRAKVLLALNESKEPVPLENKEPVSPVSTEAGSWEASDAASVDSRNDMLSLQDWGWPGLPIVSAAEMQTSSPLVIVEPWEHVGENDQKEAVRASTNVAVLAKRIGLESTCMPLWMTGKTFDAEKVTQAFVGKTLVFEGGAPSVYDPSSFSHTNCPRSYIFEIYKRVLLMRKSTGPATFVCLSHQLALAALVELVKDAVEVLCHSIDNDVAAVGQNIDAVGNRVRIIKDDDVLCVGYRHINEKGWDEFATASNEVREGAVLQLHPFDAEQYRDRPDLKDCADAHAQSEREDEIKLQMEEDVDGFFLAMFHGDEVNVEAALFVNWALVQIAAVSPRVAVDAKWLENMPVGLEVTACTRHQDTHEMVTEVAAMRIDYIVDGLHQCYYTCQFHPELDDTLRDSRHVVPGLGEDGERLLHSLLLGKHIKPNATGGYTQEEVSVSQSSEA